VENGSACCRTFGPKLGTSLVAVCWISDKPCSRKTQNVAQLVRNHFIGSSYIQAMSMQIEAGLPS
jgi:hypothetical protein